MASRRDQLQAYRFLMRRQAAALLGDDSTSAEGPLRRMSAGVTASLVVAVLATAAAALYGLFSPAAGSDWRDGRSVILERETGTRYLYLGGVLHPVLNTASARLLLRGGTGMVRVPRAALAGTPRGAPVGIPGAPDSLPAAATLLHPPWTVCSVPAVDATGQPRPYTRVGAGERTGAPVPAGGAVLVQAPGGDQYLVWNGWRLRVAAGYVPVALGYAAAQPVPVGAAWLDALPQGPDLQPPRIPGAGAPGPVVAGRRAIVGQLYATGDGSGYLTYPDGLAPVTPLQAKLLLAAPATAVAYRGGTVVPIPLGAADLASAPRSAVRATVSGLPVQVPSLVDTSATGFELCAVLSDPDGQPVLTTATTAVARGSGTADAVDTQGVPVAGSFALPPGRAALVRTRPAPGVTTGTVYLVTDIGVKFPIDGDASIADLGLNRLTPVAVSMGLIQLFPTGPTLDERSAALAVPVRPQASAAPTATAAAGG